MNTRRIFLLVLLTAAVARAQAQDNPTPAPAAEPAQTEMQKWIATTDAQWQAAFKRDVTEVHEAELNKVKLQYLASLETGIAKASAANELNGALALRNEQKRFAETNVFPEQDEAGDAASVKQLRAAIRGQLARVEKENAVRAKALHVKYDQVLAQAQTQLTQRQRIDDALQVKAKREEVAAAWLVGAPAARESPAVVPPPKVTVAIPRKSAPAKSGTKAAVLDDAVAQRIMTAITANTFQRLGPVGPKGEGDSDFPREGALLVGFEYDTTTWKGDPIVKSLRPIFLTSAGVVSGTVRGNRIDPYKVVKAKEGYAVTGLIVNPGHESLGGFQVVFGRIKERPFGSKEPDSYKSNWIGGELRKDAVVLGGNGRLAIGVFGVRGVNVGSIGLIVAP